MKDHSFCRALLKEVMAEVRARVPKDLQKEAWAYNFRDGCCEFQLPSQKLYWYGSACCVWYAKYEGWNEYLNRLDSADSKTGRLTRGNSNV